MTTLAPELIGEAAVEKAIERAGGCNRPVRLVGTKWLVDTRTGEMRETYSSREEFDGFTYVRCGNRRAAVCPTCSHEYKGDAWHLLVCGLAGGKGIPTEVADRPSTFATLTAPSFGPVHGCRQKGPCRARRDLPVCRHGRALWCRRRHDPGDLEVGQPLCWECYDYVGHVLWQWHSPELWRRFTIGLQRRLAALAGLSSKEFAAAAKVSYAKVVEFQARGLVHVHVPIRLDGPEGPDGPSSTLTIETEELEDAVRQAAAAVAFDTPPLRDGTVYRLHWGVQVDCRSVSSSADRDGEHSSRMHPERVAAYLAKYLTKATEEFGLPAQVRSVTHARVAGASSHVLRIIDMCARLSREGESYERLRDNYATLGYRGHPITKSRAYSVTFTQLRRVRRRFRRDPGLDPDADVRELLDDDEAPEGFEFVGSWVFAGQGYLDLDQAASAVMAAALARSRRV